LFNGLRRFDVRELVHLWFGPRGDLAAWGAVYPTHRGFDMQLDPAIRESDPDLERAALGFLESELTPLLGVPDHGPADMVVDAFDDDRRRITHLEALGWTRSNEPYRITQRSLADIPDVELPVGYVIRAVHGVSDAADLAKIHGASFGSQWTTEMYATLMGTPGYDPRRELVAVAPDGDFAAFTVTWHDTRNGTGLFEPVGTGAQYRRRGLARALLARGMHLMRAAGLRTALVAYEDDNAASGALYRSMGFEPTWTLHDYRKPWEPAAAG
jgi:ribosomal protein S18 acetylase RimI-like enzyme